MKPRGVKSCVCLLCGLFFAIQTPLWAGIGTPHIVYGSMQYADHTLPVSVSFNAYITTRSEDILTESSFDCSYSSGTWYVQCGNFSSAWSAGDILHVDFDDQSGNTGSVEVTLTNDPGDTAGTTYLTDSSTYVKLLVVDTTIFRGTTVDIPILMEGLGVEDSVVAYQLNVEFDSDVLLSVGAVSEGTMTEQWGDPYTVTRESDITVGGFTTNQPSTGLVADDGILVKLKFVVHGLPSSQTSNTTVIRFSEATVYTLTETIVIAHTKNGALSVEENPTPTSRDLTIYPNWNLISLSIAPDPNTLPEIFSGLSIDYVFGYTWHVDGDSISIVTPIPLYGGWNLIGYLPTAEDSINHAFYSLDTLYNYVMGFEGGGGGVKSWDRNRPDILNDLLILDHLAGYWVKMDNSGTLVYPSEGYLVPKTVFEIPIFMIQHDTIYTTPWFCDFWSTQPSGLTVGDTIEAFDSDGVLCGRTNVITDGSLIGFSVHVFGDDPNTADIDEGAVDGDKLCFTINGDSAYVVSGDDTWEEHGSKQIELALATGVINNGHYGAKPEKLIFSQNYPNPFNSFTIISYKVTSCCEVTLQVIDATGRVVRILQKRSSQQPGSYHVLWDGCDNAGERVSSGIYICRIRAGQTVRTKKMVLLY